MRRGAASLLLVFSGCLFAAPRYHGPHSNHFDGERFHNQIPAAPSNNFLRFALTRKPGVWDPPASDGPGPRPPERVGAGQLRVTWINHATVLLQMDELNILTDPIWSERCSPVSFLGPRRIRSPGIRFEDLPPIDVVLLSHDHYDHLDLPTLRRLQAAFHPRILTGLGNAALLARGGVSGAQELDWWQSAPLSQAVRVTSVPAQHFSNRSIADRNVTLWMGFVIEGPAGPVYFAGDTGDGPHFEQVYRRFGPVRLAVLPIGAYLPAWFMSPIHISPAEAVRAHLSLHARHSVAMHYGTFPLADDGREQPLEDLKAALTAQHVPPETFWALGFGEGRDVP